MLHRDVELTIAELAAPGYRVRHRRLDERRSNINAIWNRIGAGRQWRDEKAWQTLAAEDHLADLDPVTEMRPEAGRMTLQFELPMPSVSLIQLSPDPG